VTGGEKKKGWQVPLAGCAGFALGAATVLLVVWLYRKEQTPPAAPYEVTPPVSVTPAPSPTGPAPPLSQTPLSQITPESQIPAPPLPGTANLPMDLAKRDLLVPVQGIARKALTDTFDDARSSGRVHDAIDIMAPRNTPVLAVEDGRIAKLFTSDLGGLTIYQFDPTETYSYYYAHLDHYAPGIKEGDRIARGQVIGYVGSTGNASPDGPHLHFAIARLGPEKRWWQGQAINPYPILRVGGRGRP
jgi:murein DD-endopeptidase MepM/ murein hydrolase activator NlpD